MQSAPDYTYTSQLLYLIVQVEHDPNPNNRSPVEHNGIFYFLYEKDF